MRLAFNKRIELGDDKHPEENQVACLYLILHEAICNLPLIENEDPGTRLEAESLILQGARELYLALTGLEPTPTAPQQAPQTMDVSQAPSNREDELWEINIELAQGLPIGYRVRFKHPDQRGHYYHAGDYFAGTNGRNPTIQHCEQAANQHTARLNAMREAPWGWKPKVEE